MEHLVEKFGFSEEKAQSVMYLMDNNFQIEFGFGGEVECIIDKELDKIITPDDVWLYRKKITDCLIMLSE
jgi:hypothetical protein